MESTDSLVGDRATRSLQVNGLRVALGRRVILDGLSFRSDARVIGVMGPNGAGKTTLLRTLATVLPPASGDVRVLGTPVGEPVELRGLRRKLGYLPQDNVGAGGTRVRDLLTYVAWLRETPPERTEEAVARALAATELEEHASTRLRKLSGGLRRRASIAQALVNDPEMLVFDEPTVGLDPEHQDVFREVVREASQQAQVVLSTHVLEDIAELCDEVLVLRDGALRFHGRTTELAGTDNDGAPSIDGLAAGYREAVRA